VINLKEYRQATEITSFFMFSVFLMHPVLAPYIKILGFSDFHASLMFALFPLTMIFASTFFGSLSDSIGRKTVMIFGIILQIIAVMLYLMGIPALIILARFLEAHSCRSCESTGRT